MTETRWWLGTYQYNKSTQSLFTAYSYIQKFKAQFVKSFRGQFIENAEKAISFACGQTEAIINNFTAGPIYLEQESKGGHEWIIEFNKDPNDLEHFTSALDNKLREINSDYDAKRQSDIALVKPKIHAVDKGTFHEWMRRRGKLGGQNKVPRLSNNREYLDDILEMIKVNS